MEELPGCGVSLIWAARHSSAAQIFSSGFYKSWLGRLQPALKCIFALLTVGLHSVPGPGLNEGLTIASEHSLMSVMSV